MNSKIALILVSILSVSLAAGLLFQMFTVFSNDAMTTSELILTITTMVVMLLLIPIFLRLWKNIRGGIPHDDEFSQKMKMFAAGYSYFSSLIIWLVLFAFHKHIQQDDLLMLGLSGMIFSFGVNWLLVRRKGF
ncbi:hypothetical protein Q9251_22155 [Alkalihalobacillus macyae]|uniref:hypothetical protein n=1 Tax=Guptibacillus hwajinpoensis TaxID=208199 RepID=UPI00273A9735|nr:hypothetical protein [Alkalihalobacillus macyae]MDP4553555.1 hypothetical protein [Alkalihalobacillus macyae]